MRGKHKQALTKTQLAAGSGERISQGTGRRVQNLLLRASNAAWSPLPLKGLKCSHFWARAQQLGTSMCKSAPGLLLDMLASCYPRGHAA